MINSAVKKVQNVKIFHHNRISLSPSSWFKSYGTYIVSGDINIRHTARVKTSIQTHKILLTVTVTFLSSYQHRYHPHFHHLLDQYSYVQHGTTIKSFSIARLLQKYNYIGYRLWELLPNKTGNMRLYIT